MQGLVIVVIVLAVILVLLLLTLYLWLEGSLKPKPSTRAFWNLSPMPLAKRLEGYFYAARPDVYLKPATWNWFLKYFNKNETGDKYYGKVITVAEAGKIVSLNTPVEITDLEHIVPYPVARSIILQQPLPSIAVMDCPCRAQKQDACEPRDVCMVVGEPFVSFVLEHHPHQARKLTVDEALSILRAEEERGHIHTAWFKDAMHGRFYTICNCCTCCCLGMASYNRGVKRIAHSGFRPVIDQDDCSGCGVCAQICPFEAIETGEEYAVIDLEQCMGCGLCSSHCVCEAISLELAPKKGVPLDMNILVAMQS